MAVKVKQHKGAWWVFIDHKGKRKAKRVGASKRAAEQVAEKIQAKIALGQFEIKDEQQRRPFNAYFQNWLDTYVKAHCKERTYDFYEGVFRKDLSPAFGGKPITDITREEVKALAYRLLAQGRAKNTVKGVLTPLIAMFSCALEDGHVDRNPALSILRRSRNEDEDSRHHADFLTREELGLLLQTCQEHFPSSYPLLSFLARTGVRIGEALALQWGDIDFHGRFAEVRRTFSNGRISTPKSGKARRIDLSFQLTGTLKGVLLEQKKTTLRKGWGEVPPWVFTDTAGRPRRHSNFYYREWCPLLKKAGLRHLRIHDLRHTFASLLIQQRESLAYVKEQLGHHSIQITVDTYGHLIPGGNKTAVDRLDGLEQATIRNLDATIIENDVSFQTVSQREHKAFAGMESK